MTTREMLQEAHALRAAAAALTTAQKVRALSAMADALEAAQEAILQANAEDMEAARGVISDVMLDRLLLTPERLRGLADGVRDVAKLPDPVWALLEESERPNGLRLEKRAVPMGVIAIIYESRPNVTSDAAALCLMAGSCAVLRCGKEAHRSARAIVAAMRSALAAQGLPEGLIHLVEDTTRQSAAELMQAVGLVDLLIPRGGAGLIQACVDGARVPCIQTGTGICHVYVDAAADQDMALSIIENAKTSRPSVCNAEEVLLVHEAIAAEFLPKLRERLVTARRRAGKPPGRRGRVVAGRAAGGRAPVGLKLDPRAAEIIEGEAAGEGDFDTEFLDYILAVAVVRDTDAAAEHIARHSTHHSEAIVTEDAAAAERFTRAVDSAAVYVNASTRFTDGGVFGMGCEMGISTQRLHARGPMGLRELCTYKYVVRGAGQIR